MFMKANSDRNTNLDLVRILAAFMVLSVHIGQMSGHNWGVGARGVELFFVLGGYLGFASLDRDSRPLEYYKKRLVRILPVYWICLVLIYLEDIAKAIYMGNFPGIFLGQCGPGFFRYVFLIHMFTPTKDWALWNNHNGLWTMSVFVFFYIVAPFLYRLMKRFWRAFVVTYVGLLATPHIINGVAYMFASYPAESYIEGFCLMNPISELYCFLLGATLFIAIKENKQALYGFFVVLALVLKQCTWYKYELCFVLLVLVAVSFDSVTGIGPDVVRDKLASLVTFVSRGSFALYLIHPLALPVAPMVWDVLGIQNNVLYTIYLYLVACVASYVVYYLLIAKAEKWAEKKFLMKTN